MLPAVERQPPRNLEAEQAVLGSLIIDPESYLRVAEFLRADDFYRESHATVYNAITSLAERNLPSDFVTLCDELARLGVLEGVGGAAYVTALVNSVPTSTHIEYYARIVERTATLRRLIAAGGQIAALGYQETDDIERTLDEAEQIIFRVSQRRVGSDFVPLKALIGDYLDKIDYLHENRGKVAGVPTGFIDLDKLTGGLQPSDLVIIAARPSVGKSALALSIAHATALKYKTCVGIFTLEMSGEQLVQRFISIETGIDQQRLRLGQIEDREWDSIVRAASVLSEAPIWIDDTVGISTLEMRAKCRRLASQYPLGLIVVDYLQLMQSRRNVDNRVAEISEISRSLKGLAREMNVPVVALSQLSRAVETRTSHEPQLSDLRESGCLAGDSLVSLWWGQPVPIASLVGTEPEVATLDGRIFSKATASKVWRTGRRPVLRLSLRSGKSIRATANHKFRVLGGWKPLGQIRAGERLATASRSAGPGHARPVLAVHLSKHVPRSGGAVIAPDAQDVSWDVVERVEDAGEDDVYDATVPGTHNFVANGIVAHNSIEQDADVVMFIYRDEVYNQASDKKGIADIIVAKHRNGPVGRVSLRFVQQLAYFADLDLYHPPDDA